MIFWLKRVELKGLKFKHMFELVLVFEMNFQIWKLALQLVLHIIPTSVRFQNVSFMYSTSATQHTVVPSQ